MRLYTVQFSAVAVTAQQDLFEITAAADSIVAIHDIHLSQLTDVKDAEEEMLLILMKSGQTSSGTGGTTPTPGALEFQDSVFGGVTDVNNTTKASAGTIVTHAVWHWNVRIPFDVIFTPETRPILAPSRRWTIELGTTPADSITMGGYVTFAEIG
jgi:hypothetical protein